MLSIADNNKPREVEADSEATGNAPLQLTGNYSSHVNLTLAIKNGQSPAEFVVTSYNPITSSQQHDTGTRTYYLAPLHSSSLFFMFYTNRVCLHTHYAPFAGVISHITQCNFLVGGRRKVSGASFRISV